MSRDHRTRLVCLYYNMGIVLNFLAVVVLVKNFSNFTSSYFVIVESNCGR
jgi:hypothetical protein